MIALPKKKGLMLLRYLALLRTQAHGTTNVGICIDHSGTGLE